MKKGFTLVEIMIVVCIIALLAALTIPNLLRVRISAQQSAVATAMHTIVAAENQYRVAHSKYAILDELDDDAPPYIDSVLASGSKQGYVFSVIADTSGDNFYAAARPSDGNGYCFYIDENGVLYGSNSASCNTALDSHQIGTPADYRQME